MSSQNHKTAIKLPLAKLPDAKSSANFNAFESPLLKNVNKGNSFTDEIAVFHLKITLLSQGDIWCPSECKQTSTKQNCHPLIIRRKVMNSMEERTTVRNKKKPSWLSSGPKSNLNFLTIKSRRQNNRNTFLCHLFVPRVS